MYQNGYGKSQDKPDVSITTTSTGQDAIILRYSTDGTAIWSARIGGTGTDTAWAVATDLNNNVIVAGQTGSATVTSLYNSDGTSSGKNLPASGSNAAFVAKYHTSGKGLWIARLDGTQSDLAYSVVTHSNGDIYVAGQQGAATMTAFNADGSAFATTIPSRGLGDAFIVKYDTDGVVQWLAQIGSTAADIAFGVKVDSAGNAYVVGQCGATSVTTTAYNANGTSGGTIPSSGGPEMFVVKYDSSGVVQWVARVSTVGTDTGQSLVIDSSDNIYVYGRVATTTTVVVTAYNSDGTAFGTTPAGTGTAANDPCIVKYDSAGFVQWIVLTGGAQSDGVNAITLDPSSNIYISYQRGGSGNGETNINKYDSSGTLLYAGQAVASDGGDSAWGLTTDSSGNLYVGVSCAQIGTTIRINNIGGAQVASYPFIGSNDSFLIKYNSSGVVQWIRRIGNANSDILYGLTYGSMNDLYQVGLGTGGSLQVYGQQQSLFSTIANSGGTDGFVVKYNTNGAAQWVARIGSTGDEIVYGTATDSSGNMYATGQTGSGTTTTFFNADTSAFATTLTSTGNDAFIVKYSTDGVVQWVASIVSTGTDIGFSAATDPSGNLYIAGQGGNATITARNRDGTDFSPTLTNGGAGDAFVVKYDSDGFVQWNARIESTQADIAYDITTDSSGNAYVTGQSGNGVTTNIRNSDDTTFGSIATLGSNDVFIAKYNTSGTVQWIARIGSTGSDIGYSVATDTSGNVYITGQSGGANVTAYEGGDGTGASFGTVVLVGLDDVFLVKYDTDGVGQWLTRIASTTPDRGFGVSADPFGNVYVTGRLGGAGFIAYSVGNIAFPITLGTSGNGDAFIVKYNTAGVVQWVTRIGSAVSDPIWDIKADRSGNVYVVGQFGPAATDLIIVNSDTTTFGSVYESCAVVKYDTNGMAQWITVIKGNTTGVNVRSIDVDIFRNIYIGGNSISGQSVVIYSSDYKPYKVLQSQRGTQEGFLIKYTDLAIPQWASIVSTAGADVLFDVKTDSSGNVYTVGQYGAGTTQLVNGDGTIFTPALPTVSGTLDGFVLKHNSSGIIQWRARIFGTQSEFGLGVATDSSGNVYVTGQIGSSTPTTFVNSDDTTTAAILTSGGAADSYIAKYNTSGTVQWRIKIASTGGDAGWAITTDSSGNVYATGTAAAASFFSTSDVSVASITDTGAGDAYLVKYDTNGVFQWVAKLGSTSADLGYGIATDSSGNVYLTGLQGGGTLTITNADATTYSTTYTTIGGQDMFVAKFNTSGIAQWVTRIGGTGNDQGRSIAVDTSGNVYVGGSYGGNPSANVYQSNGTTVWATITSSLGGNIDAFIVKYDTNGNPQWVGRIATPSSTFETVYAVTTDTAGNVYVAGFGIGGNRIWAYNGGVGSAGMSIFGSLIFAAAAGGNNTFLIKYDSSGQIQWITGFQGGTGLDEARGLATDSSGNILMCGSFTETVFIPTSE
jgi:hypothetical protein